MAISGRLSTATEAQIVINPNHYSIIKHTKSIKDPEMLVINLRERVEAPEFKPRESHRVPFLFHLLIFVCFAPKFHLLH
jgi:hypothetical protein